MSALVWLTACARPRPALSPLSPDAPAPSLPPDVPVTLARAEERGLASWYGHPYHGRRTASGEVYDMRKMSAAHRTLPFGTWVAVENLKNGRTVKVRINDRGPWAAGRVIDVSWAAAKALGFVEAGLVPVRLRVLSRP